MKCMIHFTHERYKCKGDVNERYECNEMLMKCMIHFTHNESYECKCDVNEMYDTFHTQ